MSYGKYQQVSRKETETNMSDNPYSNSRRGRGVNGYDSYPERSVPNEGQNRNDYRKRPREQNSYKGHENRDYRGSNRGNGEYNHRSGQGYGTRDRNGGGPDAGATGTGVNNAPLGQSRRYMEPVANQYAQYSEQPQQSQQSQPYNQQDYQQRYQQYQQPYQQPYQQSYQQPYQQPQEQHYPATQYQQQYSQQYQSQSHYQLSYQGQQGFQRGERNRYDSFKPRKDYNDRRDNYRTRDRSDRSERYTPERQEEPVEQEEIITDPSKLAERISFYENQLKEMESVVSLDEITGIDSKWGIKPKGFENVTSQRAKLSGLFPLPGYPRPIDFTKLEGIVKNGSLGGNDILIETSRIDPNDSKLSRTIIVTGVDFDNVDYIKMADEINKKLTSIDSSLLKTDQNVERKLKTKDNKSMIIELVNNFAATICVCMSGETIVVDGQELAVVMSRPSDYISQGYITPEDETKDIVPDNAYKVAYHVGTEYESDQIEETLGSIHKIKQFQLLQNRLTKESIGIAFVNFELENYEPKEAIIKVQEILTKSLENSDIFKDGSFACLAVNETSIQCSPCTTSSLQKFVKNLDISTTVSEVGSSVIKDVVRDNKTLRVIQIINAVTSKDLIDDQNYGFIVDDITNEVKSFGEVLTVKIPRPANDFTPGLNQFSQPGIGKVFIEFTNEKSALDAIMGLSGRLYNDRTVLCSYYDANDFHKTILLSK